eukprot:CAMPEP_0119375942 /NCGR_PEP_ID=MMETSP1334-20130426/37572_1 /TAXON_ID=127549 /ORGANISM="Calcidiscus leptoporus, Strain RCC1130" /LENGTH=337 /DNA_ID=CAMNT_0007394373 /DNA_START=198 /DNA_END=1212 /DNA_ORIENTATION=+
MIYMSVSNKTFHTAGLWFLGFGHKFIKYPRVVQTLEFTPGRRGRLHTRTADGLPLTLGVSFQYRYLDNRLYELYLNFKGEHEPVYVATAAAVIANEACLHQAYAFFNDKQGIALNMTARLNTKFEESLFAHIEALQITEVELPSIFQDAIVKSISTKQEITRSMRYKENMKVTFETDVMVARQMKEQTVAISKGTARSRAELAAANTQITQQTVSAEMDAFFNVSSSLQLSPTDALDYLWWDLLKDDYADAKEFLIGVNPAAYIRAEAHAPSAAAAPADAPHVGCMRVLPACRSRGRRFDPLPRVGSVGVSPRECNAAARPSPSAASRPSEGLGAMQ